MDEQKTTKDIIILYHAACGDGFGAAWAAWKKLGDSADYIPIEHQLPLPEGLKNKNVFFIDIIPDVNTLKKVINDNTSVVGIDHHKTSEPKMALFKDQSFDMGHSGAVLAWKYFHPDKLVPKLLLLVEDMDLWKWEYPETDKFISVLSLFDYKFDVWDKIARELEDSKKFKDYLIKGEIILQYRDKIIGWLTEGSEIVEFEGYKVPVANAPHFFASNLGNILCKNQPFSISWAQDKDKIDVSLRSDGNIDVSELARKYGGGGHKAAAGFSFPADQPFPWKMLKEQQS